MMTSASELHRVVARHLCFRAAAPLSWGFGPRSVGLAAFGSDLPVQGFAPFAKRYLLVAGPCLLAVGSAPLTDFRRLPRCFASTSRPSSSRRSLASCRCYPILGVLPLLRFPPLGSYPEQCPAGLTAGRVHPWRCRVGLRRTMAGRGRLQRFTPLGGGSPSPAHPPTRGSKPFSVLRRRLGLLAFRPAVRNPSAVTMVWSWTLLKEPPIRTHDNIWKSYTSSLSSMDSGLEALGNGRCEEQ
jgi:hypothetical protein